MKSAYTFPAILKAKANYLQRSNNKFSYINSYKRPSPWIIMKSYTDESGFV